MLRLNLTRRGFFKRIAIFFLCAIGVFAIGRLLRKVLWMVYPLRKEKEGIKRVSLINTKRGLQNKPKVIIVRSQRVMTSGLEVNQKVIERMLDLALKEMTGIDRAEDSWRNYFGPEDVVGIKVNTLGGPLLSTHPVITKGIVSGLLRASVRPENIIVFDRSTEEMRRAGYEIRKDGGGWRCFGTDLVGYTRSPVLSVGSCFSRILLSTSCLINAPILKDHDLTGVTISLKNWLGSVHNPNKYHTNRGDPVIAELNSHQVIRDRMRIVICDALRVQFHGGPAYKPKWTTRFCGLLVSQDPVAIDCVGTKLIEEFRALHGLPSLFDEKRPPDYIATAGRKYRLGEPDPHKVEVIELDV